MSTGDPLNVCHNEICAQVSKKHQFSKISVLTISDTSSQPEKSAILAIPAILASKPYFHGITNGTSKRLLGTL